VHNRIANVAAGMSISAALVAFPGGVVGQDATFSWTNATELSFVSTGGNASASTLGLKSSLSGTGGKNTFGLEMGGIRGETNVSTITAAGTAGSFTTTKTTTSQLTAESYFARGRYDRALAGAFVFTGAGWDRNTFAGVQNRYAFVAGLGRTWADGDSGHLKTDVGVTYTIQKDVDPAPGADDAFGGLRVSVDALRQLSASAQYSSALVADVNAEDTDDYRADWTNSVSVSVSERLAFKTSFQLLYDHLPALLKVDLLDIGGAPTGTTVLTPSDDIDSVLTVALVITL
jgi:putative salt-induced outer membrane protein YdiY